MAKSKPFIHFWGLQLFTCLIAALVYQIELYSVNTLSNYDHWISTKEQLGTYLNGDHEFKNDRVTLAGNRLNLSEWHGRNTVWYIPASDHKSLTFDLFLQPNAEFVLFFKSSTLQSGIRLSLDTQKASSQFTKEPSGRFIRKEPLLVKPSAGHNQIKIDYVKSQLSVNQQTVPVKKWWTGSFQFGFYSGNKSKVYVDNIRIDNGDTIYNESFSRPNISSNFTAYWLIIGQVIVLLSLFFRQLLTSVWLTHIYLLLFLIVYHGYDYLKWSRQYYALGPLTKSQNISSFSHALEKERKEFFGQTPQKSKKMLTGELNNCTHSEPTLGENYHANYVWKCHNTLGQNPQKVALIGASQVYGAGASTISTTYSSLIAKHLSEASRCPVNVYSLGFPGKNSSDLLELVDPFEGEKFDQILLIVGFNENGQTISALNHLMKKLKTYAAQVTIIVEPANSEKSWRQRIIAFAELNELPYFDMHSELRKESAKDTGFIWWDPVHLTDYGNEVFANIVLGNNLLGAEPTCLGSP